MGTALVSMINLKGGVGKSTLTMMLGEFLAFRYAKNVLLLDMDAQANLSYCMVPPSDIAAQDNAGRSTFHLLRDVLHDKSVDVRDFITQPPLKVSNIARNAMKHYGTRIDMVVSTPTVAQLDEELLRLWEEAKPVPKGLRAALAQALEPAIGEGYYDYVLIDCPPGLSVFSSTALVASRYFVAPIIPEPLSLQGVDLVQRRAAELKQQHKAPVDYAGSILNIVKHYRNTHAKVSTDVYEMKRDTYNPFAYWVPDNERLRKLGEFDPDMGGDWAGGQDRKFSSLHDKYALSYRLSNPEGGPLSRRATEGKQYRLEERLARLTEEFMERCP